MQLAVDQLTCCIKVTGVGGGLGHDVEHDLAEAVEPSGAEEAGPPRWYCIKGVTGRGSSRCTGACRPCLAASAKAHASCLSP